LTFTKGVFDSYYHSDEYTKDNAAADTPATSGSKPPPGSGASGTAVVGGSGGQMTAQEFHCGVKDKKRIMRT
jgi:hypothetical protein